MAKWKRIHGLLGVVLGAAVLFSACSAGAASADGSGGASGADGGTAGGTLGYAAEMDKDAIMTFEITVDAEAWQGMLDNAVAEEYIPVDITVNGTTVENVGIRPKGNSSLSSVARDEDSDRYSFKVKFDEYVNGQTWLGLDQLVLNGNWSDATSMKEYLSYDIMSYIGVDTPLYAYADITVNGESWGFYLAVEDYEGSYLERTHGGEGEMYKPSNDDMGGMGQGDMPDMGDGGMAFPGMQGDGSGGDMSLPEMPGGAGTGDWQPPDWAEGGMPEGMPGDGEWPAGGDFGGGFGGMQAGNGVSLVYTDDELSSYSAIFDNDKTKTDEDDHRRVVEAIKNLNAGTDLETYVDVDAVLRYLAAHTVVVNLDSYSSMMGHNYILYENDGQISILPWDYNMAFGGFQSGDASAVVNFPIDTPVSGVAMEDRPLISKLLEVPEYLELYHQYLQEIIDGYFADGAFEARVNAIDAMIGDHIAADPAPFYTYEEYKTAIVELTELGALRGQSIQGQLDGSIPATSEGQAADPGALVDASSIDMTLLGSGGMGGGGMGGGGMGGDFLGGMGGRGSRGEAAG